MSDADWELFNARFNDLFGRLREQERRMEALESRCAELERQLREREAERPVPRAVDLTPADMAWVRHGGDAVGVNGDG